MKLDLQYDSTCDAWTLRHENVVIRNAVDIEQWKQQLMVLLERMGGERGYLLIDMHGFELDPEIADDYGAVAKQVVSNYVLGIVRYGVAPTTTNTSVRLQSVLLGYRANVEPDRMSALDKLAKIREP